MADKRQRKELIVQNLNLTPLSEEGGYFSETYRSEDNIETEREGKSRSIMTIIYYMISADMGGRNYLHKNKSDIVHFFHEGWPTEYTTVSPDGQLDKFILGKDVEKGQVPQRTVKAGYFKAGRVMTELTQYGRFPGEVPFSLISEAVAPGFDYRDRHVPDKQEIMKSFPNLWKELVEHLAPKSEQHCK